MSACAAAQSAPTNEELKNLLETHFEETDGRCVNVYAADMWDSSPERDKVCTKGFDFGYSCVRLVRQPPSLGTAADIAAWVERMVEAGVVINVGNSSRGTLLQMKSRQPLKPFSAGSGGTICGDFPGLGFDVTVNSTEQLADNELKVTYTIRYKDKSEQAIYTPFPIQAAYRSQERATLQRIDGQWTVREN